MKKMVKPWCLIISLLFLSCNNNNTDTNNIEQLIGKESFKAILIDIQRDTIMLSQEIDMINNTNLDSLLLLKVLGQHNYSYESYERTLSFYIDQPQEFMQILTSIKDSLAL